MYFTDEDKILMTEYVLSKSKQDKDAIYIKLYPALEKLMVDASASLPFKYDIRVDEEMQSDIRIFLYESVMPKITLEQVDSAQAYLYVCAKNKILVLLKQRKVRKRLGDLDASIGDIVEPYKEPVDVIRKEILSAIDAKVEIAEHNNNRKHMLFLLLLRDYLLLNNFDERGAVDYLMKMLRVKKATVTNLMYQNGIKSFIFLKKNQTN